MSDINVMLRGVPRSAVRYRPHGEIETGERQAAFRRASRPVRTTAARPVLDDEDEWEESMPITRAVPAAGRRSSGSGSQGRQAKARRGSRRLHPLFLLGVGMLVALTLWVLGLQIFSWAESTLNALRYGYPRSFQTDAVVGHQDSARSPSHFMVINLHGRVEVIEWPGGDASRARIYIGPQLFGPDADQQPVSLRFAEVNGDRLPDMLIEVQGNQIVFLNEKGGFRALKPGERYTVK